MLEQPYSRLLQKFLMSLGAELFDTKIGAFIRDYDDLPTHSTFDIDFLYNSEKEKEIKVLLAKIQNRLNLVMIEAPATNGFLVLLVDPATRNDERAWAYLEFHKEVKSTCLKKSIVFHDLSYEFSKGLVVPTPDWRLLFLCVKLYRKDFKDENTLTKIKASDASTSICDKWLANGKADISSFLNSRANSTHDKAPEQPAKLQSFRKFLFINTPFLKGHSILFAIQGPDGVGKTTLNDNILSFFNKLPIQSCFFHHITGWKYRPISSQRSLNKKDRQQTKLQTDSLSRIILKFIYRKILSDYFKLLWVDLSNFYKYVTGINRLVFEGRRNSTIYITDRYIDDLFVKTVFAGHPKRLKLFQRFVSAFIEKSTKSLVLFDTAENITNRKQELSNDQVNKYYEELTGSLLNRKVNFEPLQVTDKSPEEIADKAIRDILNTTGPRIIRSMKSWKLQQKI